MNATQWIIVGWLIFIGLVQFARGFARTTRTYTPLEGVSALVEVGILVWLVASL